MKEIVVNGKTVVLRDSFPVKEFHDLPLLWAEAGELPFEERVRVYSRFIISWEFTGKPDSVSSWEELDAFREMTPLLREIDTFIVGMIANSKNSASGSSSPASSRVKKNSHK